MKILGISAFYHDSAACLIEDGQIIAAAQEERFTRKKHDPSFPENAIKFCLEYSDTKISELDAIAFYDKPLLKFERLLETYYAFAPKGFASFLKGIPVWVKQKIFLKKLIYKGLKKIEKGKWQHLKILFPEHHLSHAASAFYTSKFEESAILTIDGVGEWATASLCQGNGNSIQIHKELRFPHSIGLLYSAFTYFLGFRVNSGEYKLMGLAPYGIPESKQVIEFIDKIKNNLVDINEDGSIHLNMKYFRFATGLKMVEIKKWEKLFGLKVRNPESDLTQDYCNLAFAIQFLTEEIVLKLANTAKSITNSDNLCLAGGVALNCVANGKILNQNIFSNIYIQPASGDAGGAVGASLAAYHIYFDKERQTDKTDKMNGAQLGPSFSNSQIKEQLDDLEANYQFIDDKDELIKTTAHLIADGNVIGWFQGRMEFGPRALGNRSILADPRNTEMQKKLNLKIKYRESFRPFAPSVMLEEISKNFNFNDESPYMLMVAEVHDEIKKPVPDKYQQLELKDKLYIERSALPAITHVDFSSRLQTVNKETNPEYWKLIDNFRQITGVGVVVNTSFNVRGEPIVCNPADAFKCFMNTEMDYLVIGNYLLNKKDQKETGLKKFKVDLILD